MSQKPASTPPGEVRIVTDVATGEVTSIVTRLADGTERTLYPLTPEEIEALEYELTAPRH